MINCEFDHSYACAECSKYCIQMYVVFHSINNKYVSEQEKYREKKEMMFWSCNGKDYCD